VHPLVVAPVVAFRVVVVLVRDFHGLVAAAIVGMVGIRKKKTKKKTREYRPLLLFLKDMPRV
jgi:hypothetical protein